MSLRSRSACKRAEGWESRSTIGVGVKVKYARMTHEKWEVGTAGLRRLDEKQARLVPKTLIFEKINFLLKNLSGE